MYKKCSVLITAVCSIVCLSGCGTIGARATTPNPPPFAGLRADFEAFDDVRKNKHEAEPLWYWLGFPLISAIIIADMPVSAVFDLLCLPADLRSQKDSDEEKDASVVK